MGLRPGKLAPLQAALLLLPCVAEGLFFAVMENVPNGTYVGTLLQNVQGLSGFRFNGQGCVNYFTINVASGVITTAPSNLDREAVVLAQGTDNLSCIVQYTNASTTIQLQFSIAVLDQNDVVPRFANMNQTAVVTLPQTFAVGEAILLLQPTDADKGSNGTAVFNIAPGPDSGAFKIARIPGDTDPTSSARMLYLNQTLSRAAYNFSVLLSDMGTPPLTFLQTIIVRVTSNVNIQVSFATSRVTYTPNEKYQVGKTFARLPTVPANLSLSYQVSGDCCAVYPDGGIYFTRIIDVDRNVADRQLQVTVSVLSGAPNVLTSCLVSIAPVDINDHAPYFTLVTPIPHISAGVAASSLLYAALAIQDDDSTFPNNAIGNISVTLDPPDVALNATFKWFVGNVYSVTLGGIIYDQIPYVTMTLLALDQGTPSQTGAQDFRLIVDGPPEFAFSNTTLLAEGAPIGKCVLTVNATKVDKGANTYSIVEVDKMVASNWFSIHNSTGLISVTSALDQAAVNGAVRLTIMAVNAAIPPASTTMDLTIKIPPPIVSFHLMSYQYHSGYSAIDILRQNNTVYMEFLFLKDGTLLWEKKSDGTIFALDIVDGYVQVSSAGQVVVNSSTLVMRDRWYSLQLVSHGSSMDLQVWPWERHDNRTEAALMSAQLQCSPYSTRVSTNGIYLAGPQTFAYSGFVGSLRNVILGASQLDLTCPSLSANTSVGVLGTTITSCATPSCSGSNWCLVVEGRQICGFAGGFVLTPSQLGKAFDPVGFTGNSALYISLDTDFFTSLARTATSGSSGSTVQVVNLSFRPMTMNGSSLLLQSKTTTSIHILKLVTNDGKTALIYQVDSIGQNVQTTSILISQSIQVKAGTLYNVTIQISNTGATVSCNAQSQSSTWVAGQSASFMVVSPYTQVVLGSPVGAAGGLQFSGCIQGVSIDGVSVPLTGLLTSDGYNKVSSTGVFPFCSSCSSNFPPLCDLASSSCVEGGSSLTCVCSAGFSMVNNACVSTVTPAPNRTGTLESALQPQASEKFPLVAIIGTVAGVLVVMIVVVLVAITVLRCVMRRTVKQRTYSVTPEPNYVSDPKSSSPKRSLSLKSQQSQLPDGSEASSQQAPVEMMDRQSETNNSPDGACPPPPHHHPSELARSKSVTSAETGFNTCSERDERSAPRAEEGKETDYSQLETGSEDTSCMEEILSPAGMNLIGSMSQNLGITYQPVLTEAEKRILTPLRPGPEEPLSLTVSEYAADIADHSAYNYRLRPPFCTLQSMPEGHEVPSRNTPPWYNSDSETEDGRRKTEDARRKVAGSGIPKVASMPPSVMTKAVAAAAVAAATPPAAARETAPSRCQRHRLHSADSPLVHSHSYKYGRQSSCRSAGNRRGLSPLELSSEGSEGYGYVATRHQRYGSPLYFDKPEADYSERAMGYATAPRSAGPYGQQEFKDLKSVSNINPISYWEMQSRMKTTVDQDPYPLSHLEDASTQTNSDVFTDPLNVDYSSHTHNATDMMSSVADLTPNCHTDTTAKVIPPAPLNDDDDDYDDKPEMGPNHFPSADCSEEYGRRSPGGTLVVTESDDDSTRLSLSSDYYHVPSSYNT